MSKFDQVLDIALQQVGYVEGANNDNKYGKYWDENNEPWCMFFVQWVFAQAEARLPYNTGSCSTLLNWYRGHMPERVFTTPKIGDIAIYNWGHTGIVLRVWSTGDICTIEGNTSPNTGGNQSNGEGVYVRNRTPNAGTMYIRALSESTEENENMDKWYNNIDEVPEWYRVAVQKLINMGVLNTWPISEDMARVFTVMYRLGLIKDD